MRKLDEGALLKVKEGLSRIDEEFSTRHKFEAQDDWEFLLVVFDLGLDTTVSHLRSVREAARLVLETTIPIRQDRPARSISLVVDGEIADVVFGGQGHE